ncbi:hypothetical protein ACFQL1_14425 [Halomicroarcula sp. GCM10025709]|uniref:hypothetical protein n=1 Tax=Halomicroarcula sp. GCM10025709 TaxID=3252669 RepID=UPI0036196E19
MTSDGAVPSARTRRACAANSTPYRPPARLSPARENAVIAPTWLPPRTLAVTPVPKSSAVST